MQSFSELLDLHRELDEMFFAHQRKLLRFEFDEALSLERYEKALLAHMRAEEEILFPVSGERAQIIKGGGVQLFLDEHYKMKKFVELLKEEIVKLMKKEIVKLDREPSTETKLIWLLEREGFYKRLCSHHDKGEDEILYRELDRTTTAAEKAELLSRVTCAFSTAKAA